MTRRHFRDLWSFGIHVTGIELLSFVNSQADRFIVGAIAGPTALGFYYVSIRVYSLVSDAITTVMGTLALPTFARMQHEPLRLRAAFYTATRVSTLIAAPVFGALFVLAPDLVPLLFGEGWSESIPVLQVLCALGLVVSAAFFDRGALLAIGKQKAALALTGGQAFLNIVIALFTVPYGILAVASGVSARQYVYWPVRLWVMRRAIGLDVAKYMWQWARPVLAGAAMVAGMLVLRMIVGGLGPLPTVLICGSVGLGMYLLLIWTFARNSLLEVVDLLRR
jgi:O-antigen/teichoic acid export membrane protein